MNSKNNIYRFLSIIVLSGLYFLLSSCSLNNEPLTKHSYSVLVNLMANSPTLKIYIYKTLENEQTINRNTISHFYNDAKINIRFDNSAYNDFTLETDTIYSHLQFIEKFYTNRNVLSIEPKTKYELIVEIDNQIVTGSTTIPGNFQIISPNTEQTFTSKNKIVEIPLKWTQSSQAKGYILDIHYFNALQHWEEVKQFTLTDTLFNYKIDFDQSLASKGKYKFEILAFDKNYYSHVIEKLPAAGIEGAYGYFGSSVLKSVTVKIE